MKKKMIVAIILISSLSLTQSCAYRMIDGSVLIKSANNNTDINTSLGKESN